jgi:hypothetical protein
MEGEGARGEAEGDRYGRGEANTSGTDAGVGVRTGVESIAAGAALTPGSFLIKYTMLEKVPIKTSKRNEWSKSEIGLSITINCIR